MLNVVEDRPSEQGWLAISETATPGFIDRIVNDDVLTFLRRAKRHSLGSVAHTERRMPLHWPTRRGYDSGMTQKITVSLSDDQAAAVRRAVSEGRAPSFSGYIGQAIEHRESQDGLLTLLQQLDTELGPVSAADEEWAEQAVRHL